MTKSQLNILIADDDDGDRRQVRRVLRQAGIDCRITEASDLREAREACTAETFDCAIVDYRMPGEDGLHGISQLKEQQPHMAVIMVTGQGDEIIASEAIKLGAADYVPKSQLDPGYLGHVVRSALHKVELERKVAEQKAELESFAHVLAHDLKTPIHQIQYLARFIENDVEEQRWDKLLVDCEKVVSTAKRMEDLINTLQQYTRLDAKVPFGEVSLDAVLGDCIANLAPDIAARRARIVSAGLPAVHGNVALLTQLMQNLIGNGIKYCRAETPEIRIRSKEQGGYCHIGVEDNGIGIAPEYRKRIFEPFKRLHSADQFEGTGLGLATCRKIVERHGGDIWCESGEDGGSVFWFTLPPAMEPAVAI